MRQKIDGIVYDTDTAEHIADNDGNPSDYHHPRVTLYRTRTGKHFLFKDCDFGRAVWPCTDDEARYFAEDCEC